MLNNILKIPKKCFSPWQFINRQFKHDAQPTQLDANTVPKIVPPSQEMRFSLENPATLYHMSLNIGKIIEEARSAKREIVVLCIGTDRSTGDSLGPLSGSKLKLINAYPNVYGTLDEPVHATNLEERIDFINNTHSSPFIIAVDACLGKFENIGSFALGRGSVKPGSAVNKKLPEVGSAYITGIVNIGGFMEHMVLQSTRLSLVVKMADTIARSLSLALGRPSVSK